MLFLLICVLQVVTSLTQTQRMSQAQLLRLDRCHSPGHDQTALTTHCPSNEAFRPNPEAEATPLLVSFFFFNVI